MFYVFTIPSLGHVVNGYLITEGNSIEDARQSARKIATDYIKEVWMSGDEQDDKLNAVLGELANAEPAMRNSICIEGM